MKPLLAISAAIVIAGILPGARTSSPVTVTPSVTAPPPVASPSPQPAVLKTEAPVIQALVALRDKVPVPRDGQLSPRGQWRWNTKLWQWVPVPKAAPTGHWETVCTAGGCRRVWVNDTSTPAPAGPLSTSRLKAEAAAGAERSVLKKTRILHTLGPRAWQSRRYR